MSILAALLAALTIATARGQALQLTEPTHVISGDEIRSLSLATPDEIMDYVGDARTLSFDGFTGQATLGGLSSWHQPPPLIFVDGHPVDVTFVSSGQWRLLGIPIEAIDRVEVFSRPSLVSGLFAGNGAIHIFTRQEYDGLGVHGASTVEVTDKLRGSHARGTALVGSAAASLMASATYARHASPAAHAFAPALVGTWRTDRVHASALGTGAAADWDVQLPYDVDHRSVDFRSGLLSTIVTHRIGSQSFLRHRAAVSSGRTDGSLWSERRMAWMSAFGRMFEERIVVLGATAEVRRAEAGNIDRYVRWGGPYAAIAGVMGPGVRYRGGGMVAMDGHSVAVKAYGGITFTPSEQHRADLYITVVDGLLHEQNPTEIWVRSGIESPLLPVETDRDDEDVTVLATADAEWRWRPSPLNELRIAAGIRRSQKVYLPTQTIVDVDGRIRQDLDFAYVSGTQGVLTAELSTHALPGRQRVFASWQRTILGDEAYRHAWRAIPDVRGGMSFATPVYRGFRMRGELIYETNRHWPAYAPVGSSAAELDARTLVDLYVTKRLLAGRVHLTAGVEHAGGRTFCDFPLGEAMGRRFRIDLRVDLERGR